MRFFPSATFFSVERWPYSILTLTFSFICCVLMFCISPRIVVLKCMYRVYIAQICGTQRLAWTTTKGSVYSNNSNLRLKKKEQNEIYIYWIFARFLVRSLSSKKKPSLQISVIMSDCTHVFFNVHSILSIPMRASMVQVFNNPHSFFLPRRIMFFLLTFFHVSIKKAISNIS